jgi:hypothetical protein
MLQVRLAALVAAELGRTRRWKWIRMRPHPLDSPSFFDPSFFFFATLKNFGLSVCKKDKHVSEVFFCIRLSD